MQTAKEIITGYLKSLGRPSVTILSAMVLITLSTLSPVITKSHAALIVPVYLVSCAVIIALASLLDDALLSRSGPPWQSMRPRNNAVFITTGDWPGGETRYHGGKVPQAVILELLLTTDVICVQLDNYLVTELSRITGVLPDTWARLDHRAHYKRGDWVVVIHGDPGIDRSAPAMGETAELGSFTNQPFWLELLVIDEPPAPNG